MKVYIVLQKKGRKSLQDCATNHREGGANDLSDGQICIRQCVLGAQIAQAKENTTTHRKSNRRPIVLLSTRSRRELSSVYCQNRNGFSVSMTGTASRLL